LQKQEEIIDEKQRVVTKNMIVLLKKRMDAIYELCEPIEQFGTDLGEAFVSSDKTIKEAVGSMINSFLKLTVSMTQNWIKQRLMQQIHNKIMEMFNLYLIIGGMPAAVERYRSTENIDDVMEEHRAIIEQYKLDFTQYEEENRKLIITHIYELIPAELNEKNKRFMIADINKNLRYDRISDSFVWLWKSGVALGVFNTTEPTIPLMLNEKSALFKLFISDVGLLTTIYGKSCKLKIVNKESDINKGAVFENVVAQELHAHGYPLYYYNSKKQGEIDFIVEQNGKSLPIEVKSGKAYNKHSALNNLMNAKEYGIEEAFIFTNDNVKIEGKLNYLPIYMVMFLRDEPMEFADIRVGRYRI